MVQSFQQKSMLLNPKLHIIKKSLLSYNNNNNNKIRIIMWYSHYISFQVHNCMKVEDNSETSIFILFYSEAKKLTNILAKYLLNKCLKVKIK